MLNITDILRRVLASLQLHLRTRLHLHLRGVLQLQVDLDAKLQRQPNKDTSPEL